MTTKHANVRSDRVRNEWLRRVEAEYRSSAVTQHLTLWLTQVGAPPTLVRAGLRIARDELGHAEMSHRTYLAAGGREVPRIVRESLELARSNVNEPLEHDVARVGVDVFCLGETVAVPLFSAMRKGCTAPIARRTLDHVLRDEVRHRDFGWDLLAWLLETPMGGELRALIHRELPEWLARVRGRYTLDGVVGEGDRSVTAEERAWGMIPSADYVAIVERTHERLYRPRFAALGIEANAPRTPTVRVPPSGDPRIHREPAA